MAELPSINDVLQPVLLELSKGCRNSRECVPGVAANFGLEEDATITTRSDGSKPRIMSRISWAIVSLSAAGLIEKIKPGHYEVTDAGRKLLARPPERLDHNFLLGIPSYAEVYGPGTNSGRDRQSVLVSSKPEPRAPDEVLKDAVSDLQASLTATLLHRLRTGSPGCFEHAVVRLLEAMGYGRGRDGAGKVLGGAGDGGIDGVINEDALGLDAVYVQAKRYAAENAVGRPAIQQFVGSLTGEGAAKGVFVTTSAFSAGARDYAAKIPQRVVLIDGPEFARLMIAHGVGVRPVETITLHEIDENFFSED